MLLILLSALGIMMLLFLHSYWAAEVHVDGEGERTGTTYREMLQYLVDYINTALRSGAYRCVAIWCYYLDFCDAELIELMGAAHVYVQNYYMLYYFLGAKRANRTNVIHK